MKRILPCPTCEQDRLMTLEPYLQTIEYKKKEIETQSFSWRCSECDEIIDTGDSMNYNLAQTHIKYWTELKEEALKELLGKE